MNSFEGNNIYQSNSHFIENPRSVSRLATDRHIINEDLNLDDDYLLSKFFKIVTERTPQNCIFCYDGMESSILETCFIGTGLEKNHSIGQEVYDLRMINDIICALPTHIVAVFKDHLYMDDPTDYLRRSYNKIECKTKLPMIFKSIANS